MKQPTSRPRPGSARARLSEAEALEILKKTLGRARGRDVVAGIGDDTAILAPSPEAHCWTVDSCEEGAHFLPDWINPEQIAHKSIHGCVSDLAAMGAKPRALLCHVTLGPTTDAEFFERFSRGQARVARALSCPIIGGNLSHGPRFSVVTTALGRLERASAGALTRSGARAGDELWLVGAVGLARLGYLLLSSGVRRGSGATALALRAFRTPNALVREGLGLRGRASACMDVSDGLRRDAQTLSRESRVRIVIEGERLLELVPRSVRALGEKLGHDPLQLAVDGGEDYALLATGPANLRPKFASVIGRVERGRGAYLEALGKSARLSGGFQHGEAREPLARLGPPKSP